LLLLFIYHFIDLFGEFYEVKGRSAHFKSLGRRYKLFRAVSVGLWQRGCCSYVVAFLDMPMFPSYFLFVCSSQLKSIEQRSF